ETAAREGRFRADLFYRLNVFPVALPSLRQRRDDIPRLVAHFVQKYASKLGKRIETVPAPMMTALSTYAWPGNVRELEHLIERAVVLTEGAVLALPDWPPRSESGGAAEMARVATLDEAERSHIVRVLEMTSWRVSGNNGAASLLGVPASTLESRMRRLGIVKKR